MQELCIYTFVHKMCNFFHDVHIICVALVISDDHYLFYCVIL